jgi:hypothetical protein
MSLLLFGGSSGGGGVVTGGGGGGGTPGTGTGGGGVPVVSVQGQGQETLVWIEADGTATTLVEDNGLIVTDGPLGRFFAPMDIAQDDTAGLDGALLRNVRSKARDVSFAVAFLGDDRLGVRKQVRAWARRWSPARGDGRLRAILGDGTARELTGVRYWSGMTGDETRSAASANHLSQVVTFRAFDPFWYDTADTVRTVAGGNQTAFFPLLPFHLSEGAIGVANLIDNDGDAPAWPIWTVQGPATGVTITNGTTGDVLSMPTVALTSGQFLTIDTRPLHKAVTRDDGSNLYQYLSADSVMWSLTEGRNDVTVAVGGSGISTLATVRYRRRWLTA